MPVHIDGNPSGLFSGLGLVVCVFLIKLATLASHPFGVRKDTGVGIGGFDSRPCFRDGLSLALRCVMLTGPAGFASSKKVAGLKWCSGRRGRYG